MKNFKSIIGAVLVSCTLLVGCEKSELISFTSKPSVVFDYFASVGNKQTFTFLGKSGNVGRIAIPVTINGFPEDRDRHFEVEVVTDTISDASSNDYKILQGVIRAGRVKDTLIVEVNKTAELETKVLNLYLRVKENTEFDRGIIERQYYQIAWSNQAIMPSWNVYFRTYFSAVGSTRAYRIFVETTGLTNFLAADYRIYLVPGSEALGRKFGDYIRAHNAANPNDILVHDDGTQAGRPIVPVY